MTLQALDQLVLDGGGNNIAASRNLISTIREQYEAEQNTHTQLTTKYSQLEKAHSDLYNQIQNLKAAKGGAIPQIGVKLPKFKSPM